MGDRALVVFVSVENYGKKEVTVSPTAYMHNGGGEVPEFLNELKALMIEERANDESYALARFIGIVHSDSPHSCYNLGCFETPKHVQRAIQCMFSGKDQELIRTPVWAYDPKQRPKIVYRNLLPSEVLEKYSRGDAGVVVVDCRDFTWQAYGGYLGSKRVS